MDLSPGSRTEPETFRAWRITIVDLSFITEDSFLMVVAISKPAVGRSFKATISSQRFRLGRGFFKNLVWHFSHAHVKFEHRRFRAPPPTIDLPMSPYEFDFRM